MNIVIVLVGKLISKISKLFNLGHGSTWPGHIALKFNHSFIKQTLLNSATKIILITGTNGKTTTAKLLQTILENENKNVLVNYSGANLLNGICSAIIQKIDILGRLKCDYAIFEVDENALPLITKNIEPDYIISLNLFRDQLDRYGEVNSIAKIWKVAYSKMDKTVFILNADDPQVAYLGNEIKNLTYYFGLNDKKFETKAKQHVADSTLCPKCGQKLTFEAVYFSHLGNWQCANCGLRRPEISLDNVSYYPLIGTYAVYDTLAAFLTAQVIGFAPDQITQALKDFKPAFGRQELMKIDGKTVQLFLSKNPTSFNESLKTIYGSVVKNLLIILNDRIPDGTDVSWIWDVDFESLINNNTKIYLAGDRVYDLALRIKYSKQTQKNNFRFFENLNEAVQDSLKNTLANETLYILPTYSAMLETRKILTGKKIL